MRVLAVTRSNMFECARVRSARSNLLDEFLSDLSASQDAALAACVVDGSAATSGVLTSSLAAADVNDIINRTAAAVLGTTALSRDEALMDGGMDSIVAVEFRH